MITKQPNGLYTRISTFWDMPTEFNMTEDYLDGYLRASNELDYPGQSGKEWFDRYGISFERAKEMILTNNMTEQEIESWVAFVSREPNLYNLTFTPEAMKEMPE